MSETKSRLETLANKYNIAKPAAADKAFAQSKFEYKERSQEERQAARQSLGQRPQVASGDDLDVEFAAAQ